MRKLSFPYICGSLLMHNPVAFKWLSDKTYLKMVFRGYVGSKIEFASPHTFNEKLQWLKLYDRNPLYTQMVDKFSVKQYVANIIGEEHIIPTLGVWDRFDDIDFASLPDQFVLKCTHDSGGLVICKDKSSFDKKAARKRITKSLKQNYYWKGREWPYKNVKPRIIAEKYMEDESGELKDFKFFCFNGKAKALYVAKDRFSFNEPTKFDFFDEKYCHLPVRNGHPNSEPPYIVPPNFDLMKNLAEKLSAGIPHIRVDFYNINGHVYFGELTFYHMSGFTPFEPKEWDYTFGEWLELPSGC